MQQAKARRSNRGRQAPRIVPEMTETELDNRYWYTADLKELARKIGVPAAAKLRKDELERAIRHFIRTGEVSDSEKRTVAKAGPCDAELGLRLDLPIVRYVGNRETKEFIKREAGKLEPGFKAKPGTRYLLNRWRDEQLRSGRPITYGDLVRQAIELNHAKRGPLLLLGGLAGRRTVIGPRGCDSAKVRWRLFCL